MKNSLFKTIIIMSGLYTITLFFSGMLLAATTSGQSIREVTVSLEWEEAPLVRVFSGIEEATDFRFMKDDKLLAKRTDRISLKVEEQTVAFVLREVSRQTGLSFKQLDGTIMVHTPDQKPVEEKPEEKLPVQGRVVSGKVTDEYGEPLPGVNVIVKGTTRGTVTDVAGNYSIEVAEQELLVFSYVGFRIMEEAIAGRSVIDVTMEVDAQSLQELVINAGYWEVSKAESTGNIARVTAEDIEQQPIANPLQSIQGRMAGVYVQQTTGVPGGGFNIQIRGQNSLRTGRGNVNGNLPLYIVDGVPFTSTPLQSGIGASIVGAGNPLNSLNPGDIESIEILKDADATAIYGSRGANGVVLITTKRGSIGKPKVTLNVWSGVGKSSNKMDLLNTEQYLEMRNEAFANDELAPAASDYDINGTWDSTRYTDWQEELIGGTANMTNGQATVSGGNETVQYLMGAGFYRETTVFPGDSRYQRISTNFSINHSSLNDRFNVRLTGNYAIGNNNLTVFDLTRTALQLAPNAPAIYDSLGNLNWEGGTWDNPLARLETDYDARTSNLIGNVLLDYRIIKGLQVKASLGYTETRLDETSTTPIASRNPFSGINIGSSSFADNSTSTWIIEPQLEYRKNFGFGRLNILVGATFQENNFQTQLVTAGGFTSDALLENPQAAPNQRVSSFNNSEYKYNALFGRINYNFNSKYIVNLTGRRDGSSRFGPGRQMANFGAVGIAWIFSNENFIQSSLPFLSFGKFRASYGTTGNDQIGDYGYFDLWRPTSFPYSGVTGLFPENLFNPDFGWETNEKLEFGVELGFIQDRIFLTTSYYRNRSDDQLVDVLLPRTTGFSSIQNNLQAEIQNTGWEIELNSINFKSHNLTWTTSFNITIPRNELLSFSNIENSAFFTTYAVGKSLDIQYLYAHTGIDRETGLYTFEDVNADESISQSDDRQFLEEVTRDFFGGIQNRLTYKGFEFDFFFQFVKQTGFTYLDYFSNPGSFSNQPNIVLNRWQREGDITDIQRFTQTGEARTAYQNVVISDQNIADASFIRLKNISVSYQFPSQLLSRMKLEGLKIYLQGQNLLTMTDYFGLDPETQSNSLPPLRVMTGGVQITF